MSTTTVAKRILATLADCYTLLIELPEKEAVATSTGEDDSVATASTGSGLTDRLVHYPIPGNWFIILSQGRKSKRGDKSILPPEGQGGR